MGTGLPQIEAHREVSVTLVSGFFRVGKSSLIEHLLTSSGRTRFAAGTVTGTPASVDAALNAGHRCDQLLLEASSTSEPYRVSEVFSSALDGPVSARLDSLVTVVDARRFLKDWQGSDDVEVPLFDGLEHRTLVDLLCEQVEFADVLVLNKTDLTGPRELARLRTFLSLVNPGACIVDAVRGRVVPDAVLGMGRFYGTPRAASTPPAMDLAGTEDEIKSHVYRSRRPFQPERLHRVLSSERLLGGVLRSKGEFWLASRMDTKGYWSQAGCAVCHDGVAPWYASREAALWPDDVRRERIEATWAEPWGDRRQELSFIGTSAMNERAIDEALDSALLGGAEMELGPEAWRGFCDPFPAWNEVALLGATP